MLDIKVMLGGWLQGGLGQQMDDCGGCSSIHRR